MENSRSFFSPDPIVVGYDPTVYTTSEGEGMVELNIFVFSHPVTGTPRPFTLSVSTIDGTAGMSKCDRVYYNPNLTSVTPGDYGGVIGQIIQFNTGDTNQTHTITIAQDDICENDPFENFFSNIALDGGIAPINVIQTQATVIIDDSMEPECGMGKVVMVQYLERYYIQLIGPKIYDLSLS